MTENPNSKKIFWILRIAAAGCFIGHGAFGLLKKPAWLAYYAVFHISPEGADKLYTVIGMMDIFFAILVLLHPCRAALLWMTFWGIFTSFLRPLAGEGFWEFFERAGNFGAPLALLAFGGWFDSSVGWFSKMKERPIPEAVADQLALVLKYSTGLLLIGHGGFGAFMHKEMLFGHFASVGIHLTNPALTLVGWFEIAMGLAVMIRPLGGLLIFIVVWKIATELLYPLSGAPIWEFIERFGSYGVPLALFFTKALRDALRQAPISKQFQ